MMALVRRGGEGVRWWDRFSPSTLVEWWYDFLFFLALYVLPILISLHVKQVFHAPKYILLGVIAICLGTTWLSRALYRGWCRIFLHPTCFFLFLLVLWEGVTLSWAQGLPLQLREYGFHVSLFVIFFVALHELREADRMENLLHFAIAGGVVSATYGIMQYYLLDELLFSRFPFFMGLVLPKKPNHMVKIYSFMGHRNYLAGYLVCLLPIVMSRFMSVLSVADETEDSSLRRVSWRQTFVYGAAMIVMAAALFLTQTRGAWVGLTGGVAFLCLVSLYRFVPLGLLRPFSVGVVLLLTMLLVLGSRHLSVIGIALLCWAALVGTILLMRRSMKWGKAMGTALLVLAAAFAIGRLTASGGNPLLRMRQSAFERFGNSFNLRAGSAFQRILIWKTTWWIIEDSWRNFLFGTGIGSYGLNYLPYQARCLADPSNAEFISQMNKSIYAHCEYFHFWSEIGLVGMLIGGLAAFFFFRSVYRYLLHCDTNYDNYLFFGMVAGIIGVLTHNIFSFSLHLPYTAPLFYFLVAFCLRFMYPLRERVFAPAASLVHKSLAFEGRAALSLGLRSCERHRIRGWAARVRSLSGRDEDAFDPVEAKREGKVSVSLVSGDAGDALDSIEMGSADEAVLIERPLPSGEVPRFGLMAGEVSLELQPDGSEAALLLSRSLIPVVFVLCGILLSMMADQWMKDVWWRRAFLKFRARRFDEAIVDFVNALHFEPGRGEVLFDFGRALMDSGRNYQGIRCFEAAKPTFVDPANDHNIALCYYKEGRRKKAEEHYRRALALNMIYEQSLLNLAVMLCADRDPARRAEGEKLFERGLRYYPRSYKFALQYGIYLMRQGRLEESERMLRKAYSLNPCDRLVVLNLAELLSKRGSYDEALGVLGAEMKKRRPPDRWIMAKYYSILAARAERKLKTSPSDPAALKELGIALCRLGRLKKGNFERAVSCLRKVLERNPGDLDARFFLGLALAETGYKDEARVQLGWVEKRGRRGNPYYDEARSLLMVLRSDDGGKKK